MRRKLLAVLLVLTMMIGILPLAAFAEGDDVDSLTQSASTGDEIPDAGTHDAGSGQPVVTDDAGTTGTQTPDDGNGQPTVSTDGDPAVAPKEETESCKHEYTHWTVINQHEHAKACDDCHLVLGDQESHQMVDGTCTICGYHACEDGHTWGNDGYLKHVCLVCGYVTDHKLGAGCVCEICGEIFHPGYSVSPLDESYCKWICTECGAEERRPHNDENGDGICDYCGYQLKKTTAKDENLDDVPRTGDLSTAVAGVALMIFGTAAALLKRFAL